MFIHFKRDCEDTIKHLENQLKFNEEIRLHNVVTLNELKTDNIALHERIRVKDEQIDSLNKEIEQLKAERSSKISKTLEDGLKEHIKERKDKSANKC